MNVYMCECLHECSTCVPCPHEGQKRALYPLELELGFEPWSGCWELNLSSARQLLTADLSLQPQLEHFSE